MTILYYNNNPKLKAAGVQSQITPAQQAEFIKCARDPVYFIKNYIKIVHVDLGVIPFGLWPFQEELVLTIHNNRFVIAKCPRQVGKTTTVIAYFLHSILFKKAYKVAILANKGSLARDILDRLKKAYELLPFWMQHGVITWNKGSIELETGSKIIASATTASGIRGETYNAILLDEFAHVEQNMAEEFFTSVYPTISSGKTTKMVVISTPKGMNHFYKMWMAAEQKISKYVPFAIDWSDVPGRDEAWKQEQIANTSQEQFDQEHNCVACDTNVIIKDRYGNVSEITIEELKKII